MERRETERRVRLVDIRLDQRSGRDRRDGIDRRERDDRRRNWRPAQNTARPAAGTATTLSARDRTKARMLPDEFLSATGGPGDRLQKVIRKKWANAPRQVRAGLVDGLMPILEPLKGGTPINEAIRDACEEVVSTWLAPFHRR